MGSDGSLPTWFRLNANFNPRSPDGERRSDHCRCHYRPEISIHAPRMGSDYAPLICFNVCSIFQSTLPGWGATFQTTVKIPLLHYFNPRSPDGERLRIVGLGLGATYFNPRSPDGERQSGRWSARRPYAISIHAPRMGSDAPRWLPALSAVYFNPRSPDGERHGRVSGYAGALDLFQSTLPGWGATKFKTLQYHAKKFQSTLPGWGATSFRPSNSSRTR